MKQLLTIILFFTILSLQAQDYSRIPVVSKVTATWCPNCGTWGWSFMEGLKQEFKDGSAILLGVHHSGELENPVSDWFSKNLGNTYQPQFFVNNQQFSVNSGNWSSKIQVIRDEVDKVGQEIASSAFSFGLTYIDSPSNVIHTTLNLKPVNKSEGEMYLAIYVYENKVVNYQSQQGQNAIHPFVLRDIISDNYWGDAYTSSISQTISKSYVIENTDWDTDNLGLLAIMWEKSGTKYIVDNARKIDNIGLLSDSEDLLDENLFTINNLNGYIEIISSDNYKYQVALSNINGQIIKRDRLIDNLTFTTSDFESGIYVVTIKSNDKSYSKLIFLK